MNGIDLICENCGLSPEIRKVIKYKENSEKKEDDETIFEYIIGPCACACNGCWVSKTPNAL